MEQKGQTLYDKIWDAHHVGDRADGNALLYIDLQLLHEVTSPQAFEGLHWPAPAVASGREPGDPGSQRAHGQARAGLEGITDPSRWNRW